MKPVSFLNQLKRSLFVCSALLSISTAAHAVVFQAEDYKTYNDTTPGNSGGAYRNDNADIEASSDTGGGYNIGWIAAGEWWSYSNFTVATTGSYTINLRVASTTGGTASVDLNGGAIQLGNFAIPATGGWQKWTTVSRTVTLNAGTYNLGVFAQTGSWNYNWIEVVPNAPISSSSSSKSSVASSSSSSTPKWSLLVQAEEYSAYNDTTVGNAGGAYRKDNVDIEPTIDQGGGYNVGWIDATEWLAYNNITIPSSGTYTIRMRVASPAGGTAAIDLNGGTIPLGDIALPVTSGYQSWATVTRTVNINAGTYSLGVFAKTGGWNLNWIEITSENQGGSSSSSSSSSGSNATWSDEFDTINTAVWGDEIGDNIYNHERQYYTAGKNSFIQFDQSIGSNVLVMEARKENPANYNCWYGRCEYTSARMSTSGKKTFQYGRIEARMKLPHTQGIWPAFWMLGADIGSVGWPNCGEIDIMEHVGYSNEAKMIHGTIHGPNYSGGNGIGNPYTLAGNVDAGYHVYAVDWTATSIKWYVDGVLYFSQTKAQVETKGNWAFSHPFYLILNNAVGGDWPGLPDGSSVFPQRVYVDYIRVYQ